MRKPLISVLILASLLFSLNASAQTLYGLRATIASQAQWGSFGTYPARWTGNASYCQSPPLDQCFNSQWAAVALFPYGTAAQNGYFEFPGSISVPGSLANFIMGQADGACVLLDVNVLAAPNGHGLQYVVTTATHC